LEAPLLPTIIVADQQADVSIRSLWMVSSEKAVGVSS
jgi:hypothetical protein